MDKYNGIIESRLKNQLSITNFSIKKSPLYTPLYTNSIFGNYLLTNTLYPYKTLITDNIIKYVSNNKNTQTKVKTSDIGIQCNLFNKSSENNKQVNLDEDEWFFVNDKISNHLMTDSEDKSGIEWQ
jgi:hypothetical protein